MFQYPWGDFHSLNLGWFLIQFKAWTEKIQEYLDNGGGTSENLANVIAPVFNAGQDSNTYNYQKYAICRYNDKLWMCNTNLPVGGEEWVPSHWDEITVGAGLTGLRRSADTLSQAITALNEALSQETEARQEADSELEDSLNTISENIDDLELALSTETTTRENTDTAIQGAIATVQNDWQAASRTFVQGEYIYSTTYGRLYKLTAAVPQGTSFEGKVASTTIGDVLSSELLDISEQITLTIQDVSHNLFCRRFGKNVWLNAFSGTPQTFTQEGGWVTVGTLSPNYRPPRDLLHNTRFNDVSVQIRIQTNGTISFAGIPAITNAYVVFSINYITN